jgi:sporulation protein YlmC with PRC-barrel domain
VVLLQYNKLKNKRVINIYNGKFIGYVTDINIELPGGEISSISVQYPFFKRIVYPLSITKVLVLWSNIVSIGKDVILVNIIDK